jgi:putative NADH-flavin reductase
MKLVVIGATGGSGSQVVAQALAGGHIVTAIVRRPAAVTLRHPRLEVIRGDVFEPATLARPIRGQEGVVSTLGVTRNGPTTLFSTGIVNIMQAMQSTGVRRLICVSASGLNPGPGFPRWLARQVLWLMFKEAYTDMARMEAAVKASDLAWTIVRPPRLTNGPHSGQYHIAVNKHLNRGWTISRADLADFIVTHLEDPQTYCAQIEVAH